MCVDCKIQKIHIIFNVTVVCVSTVWVLGVQAGWPSTEQQQRCYRWCQWSVLFQPIIINRPPDTISAGLFPAQEWAAESKCNTDHNLIIKTQHNSANFRNPPLPAQELRLETVGASNLVTRYSAQSWVVTVASNDASRKFHNHGVGLILIERAY